MKSGPFEIKDLDPVKGWMVSWPGYDGVVAAIPIKVDHLLKILFNEMRLWEARLCIWLRNGEFDTYTINLDAWAQDQLDHLADLLSSYPVGGVRFDDEARAREFLEILEKIWAWRRLGGSWA